MKNLFLVTIIILLGINIAYSQNNIDPNVLPLNFENTTLNFNNTAIFQKERPNFIIGWNHGAEGRQLSSSFPVINKDYQDGGGIIMNYKLRNILERKASSVTERSRSMAGFCV